MSSFVAKELTEVLGTKVMIGRINIGLLNRIIIDDVLLDDQSGQEMLKVTRLSAKFDIMPFFKGKISISSVQLFGFNISLQKDTPESFQFLDRTCYLSPHITQIALYGNLTTLSARCDE